MSSGAGGARSAAGDKANPTIIKSVLEEERDLIIGIDAHGIYSSHSLEKTVVIPEKLIVIEIGLPTQYTYAKYYDYMYAIFIKPILLNYLYHSTSEMDNLYKMLKRGVDLYSYSDIYTEESGKKIQENILYGNYDVLRNAEYHSMDPLSKKEFESKLEILSEVIKNVTIYMPGELITSRSISAYEHPVSRPDEIDISCGVDVIDEYSSTIWKKNEVKKGVKKEDEVVRFDKDEGNPLNPLLDPIFVNTGILTGEIIEGLGEMNKRVKLIIFTCSTIDSEANLEDTDTNELIESVTRVRRKLQEERSNNSGPGIAAIGRKQVVDKDQAYSGGIWCITSSDNAGFMPQYSILRYSIEEFHESALEGNVMHVTSNNDENDANNSNTSKEYCSPREYYGVTRFTYVVLQAGMKEIIKKDGDIQLEKIEEDPFISLSLKDLIANKAELYDSLYLISKVNMYLYKVSSIFKNYISKDIITSNKSGLDLLILQIYQELAAEYILKPFQVSQNEDDHQKIRVLSFDRFKDITIEYINNLSKVNKLHNDLEKIEMNISGRIYVREIMTIYTKFDCSSFDILKDKFEKLKDYKGLDNVEKILKYIEMYKQYLSYAIQYLVYISTSPTPTDDAIKEWEKNNYIDIDETNDPMQNACIAFYKETCLKLKNKYAPTLGTKRGRPTRYRKNRRAYKTRRKNRK